MHTRLEWRHLDHTIHIHTIHSTNNTVFSLVMPSGLLGAAPQISNSCCNPSIASIQYPHSSSSLISGPLYLQALKRSTPPQETSRVSRGFFSLFGFFRPCTQQINWCLVFARSKWQRNSLSHSLSRYSHVRAFAETEPTRLVYPIHPSQLIPRSIESHALPSVSSETLNKPHTYVALRPCPVFLSKLPTKGALTAPPREVPTDFYTETLLNPQHIPNFPTTLVLDKQNHCDLPVFTLTGRVILGGSQYAKLSARFRNETLIAATLRSLRAEGGRGQQIAA